VSILLGGVPWRLALLKIDGRWGWMVFFSTHPPLELRIAALSTRR
jgi:Zn-dependent protease with chaperone function